MNLHRLTKSISLLILLSASPLLVTTSTAEEFAPRTVIRKPFRAIVNAPVMSAEAAGRTLHGNELVLGVVVGEHARAYPINMLTGPTREIINDTLGETAIAATW